MKCDACGAPVAENGKCTYCGKVFVSEGNNGNAGAGNTTVINHYNVINQNTQFTGARGTRNNYMTITSDKSKTVALILCICFGYVGAHYFYVGRFGRGLVALCTLDYFMIGWIIDIFVIMSGTFKDNVGIPLRE
jgi:restriction system protein